MLVYHGSYTTVERPDISFSRNRLDFGKGFYVTPLRTQATKWASRFAKGTASGILNIYEIDVESIASMAVTKSFEGYTEEWLSYIVACRRGEAVDGCDFVAGGIANDKVFDTVELFFEGLIDASTAIGRLEFEEPNMQMCFRTQAVLDHCLRFVGSEEVYACS